MNHGYNPQEPPDDRKTFDDMARFPKPSNSSSVIPQEGDTLIARIIFKPDSKEVIIERPIEERVLEG